MEYMMLRIAVIWHERREDQECTNTAVYESIPFGSCFSECLMGCGKMVFKIRCWSSPFWGFNEGIIPTLLTCPQLFVHHRLDLAPPHTHFLVPDCLTSEPHLCDLTPYHICRLPGLSSATLCPDSLTFLKFPLSRAEGWHLFPWLTLLVALLPVLASSQHFHFPPLKLKEHRLAFNSIAHL